MNKQNSKLKIITALVAIINIALVGGVGYLYYELGVTKDTLIEITKERLEIERQISNALATEDSIKNTAEDRKKIDSYFIDSREETIALLTNIESLADDVGVEVDVDIDVKSVVLNEKDRQILSSKIEAMGTFQTLYRFVSILESLPYKVTITGLNMKRVTKKTGEEQPKWSGDIAINILSYEGE